MSDRKPIDSTAWATFLLTLLVLVSEVLAAPLPSWGFVAASALPHGLIERFDPTPPFHPTISSRAAPAGDAVERESALLLKEKEQDGDSILADARVSFAIPICLRYSPDRESLASRPIFSHFHLRC